MGARRRVTGADRARCAGRAPLVSGRIGAPVSYATMVCMAWKPAHGERRCAHKSSRTGEQCKLWGVVGTVPPTCRSHGAGAPQVRAAAERRVADRRPSPWRSRMEVQVPRLQTPGEAAQYTLGQVQRRAAQFAQAADQLTSATYLDRAGQERIRAVLAEERRWLDSMVKLLGVAAVARPAPEPTGPTRWRCSP